MDYESLIRTIINPIVEDPDSVLIRTSEEDNGKDVIIIIASEKNDTARLIGKHGMIANAIRDIASIGGISEEKRIHIKFESFGEEKED